MSDCRYCGPSEATSDPVCAAGDGGFVCTRPPRHEGDHVGCTAKNHVVHRWPQKTKGGKTWKAKGKAKGA